MAERGMLGCPNDGEIQGLQEAKRGAWMWVWIGGGQRKHLGEFPALNHTAVEGGMQSPSTLPLFSSVPSFCISTASVTTHVQVLPMLPKLLQLPLVGGVGLALSA